MSYVHSFSAMPRLHALFWIPRSSRGQGMTNNRTFITPASIIQLLPPVPEYVVKRRYILIPRLFRIYRNHPDLTPAARCPAKHLPFRGNNLAFADKPQRP